MLLRMVSQDVVKHFFACIELDVDVKAYDDDVS